MNDLVKTTSHAEFLQGSIVDTFLPTISSDAFDPTVAVWSTPVCRFVTRNLCTSIFCGPGTTRDPTVCPTNPLP
jgi:hypothetical protein